MVRNGSDLWTWSSNDKRADPPHRRRPSTGRARRASPTASPMTPQQAADAALKAITPTTRCSTDGRRSWPAARRTSWCCEPRDTGSLVDSVRIAIDGKTHVPTRVQVFAAERRQARLRGRLHLLRPDHSVGVGVRVQPAARHQGDRGNIAGPDRPVARRGTRAGTKRRPARGSTRPRPREAHGRRRAAGPRSWSRTAAGARSGPGSGPLAGMLRSAAQGQRHLGLGTPAPGHAVLRAAHRRRPASRSARCAPERPLRRPGDRR